jgi:hypothetical protein
MAGDRAARAYTSLTHRIHRLGRSCVDMSMTRCGTMLILLALVGCTPEANAKGKPKPKPAKDEQKLDAHTNLGAPLRHANLTLVPMLSREPITDDRDYLTLDEAFDQKLVRVRELDNESVNQLSLENLSDRPLFVMSGEVILGGKQDRIIGKDRIIPSKVALQVDVFCVEHGRWSEEGGDNREFRSAKVLAHTTLRLKANYDDQGQVWNEVESKNGKRNTENGTDTYRAVTTDGKVAKDVAPYEQFFAPALAKLPADRLVGFVVVMNGQLVGVESFASPKLFAKLRGKLLHSYYVEAVDLPAPKDAKVLAWTPTAKDVKAFIDQPAAAEETVIVKDKKGTTRQKKAAGYSSTSVVDEEAPAPDGDAQPEVYKSVYAH